MALIGRDQVCCQPYASDLIDIADDLKCPKRVASFARVGGAQGATEEKQYKCSKYHSSRLAPVDKFYISTIIEILE